MPKLVRFIFILSILGWLLAEPVVAEPSMTFIGAVYDSTNLDEVASLTLSADGRYLYVVSEASSILAVFSRDETTGMLSLVERQRDNMGPVDGLGGASGVALSPDGSHVYVAGQYDDAVAVFSRDETSGKLRFVETEYDRRNAMRGLNGAISVTVSPDGRYVYTASLFDSAITVFSRDKVTGALDFIETYKEEQPGIDGLTRTRWVTVSPDGRHVYASSLADNAIAVFSQVETTGLLEFIEVKKDGQNGTDGLAGAREMTISPDGAYLYVTSQNDQSVAVFSRNETTGALHFVALEKDGQNGVNGLAGAKAVLISPDGRQLYVTSMIDDAVVLFDRDEATGLLKFVEVHKDDEQGVDGLDGASSIAISADGRHLYVAGTNDDAIAIFSRDVATGALNWEAAQGDDEQGVDGLDGAISTAVSPDGRHLYVAGFLDDAAAAFSRDEETGQLTYIDVYRNGQNGITGLKGAIWVAVSPDGRSLYVAGFTGNALGVFSRDETTGRLNFIEAVDDAQPGVDGLGGADAIAISTDSRQLYVAGQNDNAVAVFRRNQTTGRLSFIEVHKDGQNGVEGLADAEGMALSPDDRHLYVVGRKDGAVVVFSRDGATGRLSFVEAYKNDQTGVDSLVGANAVVVSPNGRYVYAAALVGDAITVFSRDGATGRLSLVEVHKDDQGKVDGLGGASSLAFTPNGRYLYVTGANDNALALFWRFSDRGEVAFAGVEKDNENGVDGLQLARGVTVSPDGRHVYVAGPRDDAVAIFLARTGGDPIDFYLPIIWR